MQDLRIFCLPHLCQLLSNGSSEKSYKILAEACKILKDLVRSCKILQQDLETRTWDTILQDFSPGENIKMYQKKMILANEIALGREGSNSV